MEKKNKDRYLIYGLLLIATLSLLYLGIWKMKNNKEPTRKESPQTLSGKTKNTPVSDDGGGLFPTPTEDPAVRTRNILICKSEFEGLRSRAENIGAEGMLTMSTNSADGGQCELIIKSMKSIGDLGTVYMSLEPEQDQFGIILEMDAIQLQQARLWSEAALIYLSNQISKEAAEAAVKTAFEEGSVTTDLFTINVRSSAKIDGTDVTPLKVIEIRGFLNAQQ